MKVNTPFGERDLLELMVRYGHAASFRTEEAIHNKDVCLVATSRADLSWWHLPQDRSEQPLTQTNQLQARVSKLSYWVPKQLPLLSPVATII